MPLTLPTPAIFAHRGDSLHAPENTLKAFELAASLNADAIELDAKLSADGEVVVIHDLSVDRTTDGSGKVGQLSLAQLKELDAGSWLDPVFSGERIPTLGEVFEAVGGKLVINVELTNYSSRKDDLPEKVADLVEKHGLQESVFYSSSNPTALRRIHKRMPSASIGLLALPGLLGTITRVFVSRMLYHTSYHPPFQDVSPDLIAWAHRRGCKVYTYTVNALDEMHHLFAMGVDGIFTDDPAMGMRVRAEEAH